MYKEIKHTVSNSTCMKYGGKRNLQYSGGEVY